LEVEVAVTGIPSSGWLVALPPSVPIIVLILGRPDVVVGSNERLLSSS
jgi:hypothetical protein